MAPSYTPVRNREGLPTVPEDDEYTLAPPPSIKDPSTPRAPTPPPRHQARAAAERDTRLSIVEDIEQLDAEIAISESPIQSGPSSHFEWDGDDAGSKSKSGRKQAKRQQTLPERPTTPAVVSGLGISENASSTELPSLVMRRTARVDAARVLINKEIKAQGYKDRELERDTWRPSMMRDGHNSPDTPFRSSQEADDEASSYKHSSESKTPLADRRARTDSDTSADSSKVLRKIKSWKKLRNISASTASQRNSGSSSTDHNSPEERPVTHTPDDDVPPVPKLPKINKTPKLRSYFSNIRLRPKTSSDTVKVSTSATPPSTTEHTLAPLNAPAKEEPQSITESITPDTTQTSEHIPQDSLAKIAAPAIVPPQTSSTARVSTPREKDSNRSIHTPVKGKSPLIYSPSATSFGLYPSVMLLPRSASNPSLPSSPASNFGQLERQISRQTMASSSSSSTVLSPRPVVPRARGRTYTSASGDNTAHTTTADSSIALPRASMASIDPDWWNDSVRRTRERVLQDAEEDRRKEKEAIRAGKRAAKEAKKISTRKETQARNLTAGLLQDIDQQGVKPLRTLEEMTEEDFEYVADNAKKGTMDKVRDFLVPKAYRAPSEQSYVGKGKQAVRNEPPPPAFGLGIDNGSINKSGITASGAINEVGRAFPSARPASSVYSDRRSILSSLSPQRIERALGPDFDPHFSTFGIEAVQYLDALKSRQELAESSSSDQRKVTMTPELQQELVFARAERVERLKTMPSHPCLRGDDDGESSVAPRKGQPLRADEGDASRSIGPDLGINIDDVIRDWEQSSPSGAVAEGALAGGLSDELQTLRQHFGLGVLRRPRMASQSHPRHDFDWHSKKLMCRHVHNPMEILPELPAFDPSNEAHLRDFDQHFFQNLNMRTYKAPKKCGSRLCEEYCCHYGKLIAHAVPGNNDILSVSRAMKCMEGATRLKMLKPNGVDEWENFLECTYCAKEYCPACIMLCTHAECQQAFCFYCSNDKPYCRDHEEA